MARLLLLGAFVAVLGLALADIKSFTDFQIHRVRVDFKAFIGVYKNISTTVLRPEEFYARVITPPKDRPESRIGLLYSQLLRASAAEANEQFDKYNEALEKSSGDKIDLTATEFEALQQGISNAMKHLKEMYGAVRSVERAEEVNNYCHDIYTNVVLMKARGGLPDELQITFPQSQEEEVVEAPKDEGVFKKVFGRFGW